MKTHISTPKALISKPFRTNFKEEGKHNKNYIVYLISQ
jgi:hypothetical protein